METKDNIWLEFWAIVVFLAISFACKVGWAWVAQGDPRCAVVKCVRVLGK